MHRVPSLQWQTWVRLAFVKAGSDWRSLAQLRVEDGKLADYGLTPDTSWHAGALGVTPWEEASGTVTAGGRPGQGTFSVADPRRQEGRAEFGQYGVKTWEEPSQVVIGKAAVGAGGFAVADPRHAGAPKFNNIYKVVPWSATGPAVTGGKDLAVADPRARDAMFHNAYRTVPWSAASQAITGQHAPSNGAMCVADPRPGLDRTKGDDWFGGGHFGVLPWQASSGAVSAAAGYDNGDWSVADPRLPEQSDRLVAIIRVLDGTWHRPFTTLELAALQSLGRSREAPGVGGSVRWRMAGADRQCRAAGCRPSHRGNHGPDPAHGLERHRLHAVQPADLGAADGNRSQRQAARRIAGRVGCDAVTVFCTYCGEGWPRDPALEVICPSCSRGVGRRCVRPSGHECEIHADRGPASHG